MSNLFIPVILGTARAGRRSEAVANFVQEQVKKQGAKTELIDVRNYVTRPATEVDWMESVELTAWVKKATQADGFIIVSPEYNHYFPGELKMLLDQTLKAYAHKPAGLVGVSSGPWGGARMIEHLRAYVTRLGMIAVHPSAYFSHVNDVFDEQGQPKDPKIAEFAQPMLDETFWYAQALKETRR